MYKHMFALWYQFGEFTFFKNRHILSDFEGVTWFINDVRTLDKTVTEHLCSLKKKFNRLRSVSLKTQVSKCHLMCKDIQFLGHTNRQKLH